MTAAPDRVAEQYGPSQTEGENETRRPACEQPGSSRQPTVAPLQRAKAHSENRQHGQQGTTSTSRTSNPSSCQPIDAMHVVADPHHRPPARHPAFRMRSHVRPNTGSAICSGNASPAH
jgi:hypothetical protein